MIKSKKVWTQPSIKSVVAMKNAEAHTPAKDGTVTEYQYAGPGS